MTKQRYIKSFSCCSCPHLVFSFTLRFTKNLSPDKIHLSTLKGEGEMSNLELDEVVLMELLDLPTWLRLSSATCNKVAIKVSRPSPVHSRTTHVFKKCMTLLCLKTSWETSFLFEGVSCVGDIYLQSTNHYNNVKQLHVCIRKGSKELFFLLEVYNYIFLYGLSFNSPNKGGT